MALPLRTVVGTFSNPDGTPAAGSKILFGLQTSLVDAADDVTVIASSVEVVLDAEGSFSVELVPAADAVAPTPVYLVRELFGLLRKYSVTIPAGSGSVDLSDLAPVGTAPTPPSAYVLLGDYDTAVADLQAADATEATTRAAAVTAETVRAEAAEALSVPLAQRGAANGVATLDGSGMVPDGQIPASIARDAEVSAAVAALVNSAPGALDTLGELAAALQADESAAATLTTLVGTKAAQTALDAEATARAAADALAVPLTQKGANNGVATLDSGGHVPDGQIPDSIARDTEVTAAVAALVNSAPSTLDTLGELATALQADESTATTLATLVGTKAPLASPALTGTPTVNGATVEDRTHAAATYAPLTETVQTFAASGSAVTLGDPSTTGSMKDITLTAACTITLPTPVAGRSFTVRLTQDGTGSRVPTWAVTGGSTVKWPSAINPGASTTAGAQDVFTFFSISGAAWNGGVVGRDFR